MNNSIIEKFQIVKQAFLSKTTLPKDGVWQNLDNQEIWKRIVAQIIVVGVSKPGDIFDVRKDLQEKVTYHRLSQMRSESEIIQTIHDVLREVGSRYASKDIKKCHKTQALRENLQILQYYPNGPVEFLTHISELRGPYNEILKIRYVMSMLRYMKSKGARDFLLEIGMIRHAIAIDSRVQNVLQRFGVPVPPNLTNVPKVYDEFEKKLQLTLCEPLNLLGVQFDRMLYQHYDTIMRMEL